MWNPPNQEMTSFPHNRLVKCIIYTGQRVENNPKQWMASWNWMPSQFGVRARS